LRWNEEKRKRRWFVVLILSQFVLWGGYFLQENFSLSIIQVGVFLSIILLLILMFQINHWIKYLFLPILIWLAFWIFSFSIFPLFQEKPDIEWFISQQKDKVSTLISKNKDLVKMLLYVEMWWVKKEFDLTKTKTTRNLNLTEETIFSLASKEKDPTSAIFISLSHGDQIVLFPQSSLSIQIDKEWSGHRYITKVKQGTIWVFQTQPSIEKKLNIIQFSGVDIITSQWLFVQNWQDVWMSVSSGSYYLSGNLHTKNMENMFDQKIIDEQKRIYNEFEKNKQDFLIKQIWEFTMSSIISRRFNKFFLDILFTFFPERFGQNQLNYQAFEEYLWPIEKKKFQSLEKLDIKKDLFKRGLDNVRNSN